MGKRNDGFLIILDIDNLFASPDLQQVQVLEDQAT